MPLQTYKKNENILSCFVKDYWAPPGSLRAPDTMVEPGRGQQQSPGRAACPWGGNSLEQYPGLSPCPLPSSPPERSADFSDGYFEGTNWACSAHSSPLSTPLGAPDSSVPCHAASLVDSPWPCVQGRRLSSCACNWGQSGVCLLSSSDSHSQ